MFAKMTTEKALQRAKEMFEALPPKKQAIAIDLHVAAHGRMNNEVPAPVFSKAAENLPGTADADYLLDTIGALHTRNKGLQKGHATLTRRVQELEAALSAEKERGVTVMNERGMEVYSRDGVCRMRMGSLNPGGAVLSMNSKPQELSDRAVDAIIADVMKPEPTAADQRLQEAIKAQHKKSDPLDSLLSETLGSLLGRLTQPGGALYRGVK